MGDCARDSSTTKDLVGLPGVVFSAIHPSSTRTLAYVPASLLPQRSNSPVGVMHCPETLSEVSLPCKCLAV